MKENLNFKTVLDVWIDNEDIDGADENLRNYEFEEDDKEFLIELCEEHAPDHVDDLKNVIDFK